MRTDLLFCRINAGTNPWLREVPAGEIPFLRGYSMIGNNQSFTEPVAEGPHSWHPKANVACVGRAGTASRAAPKA